MNDKIQEDNKKKLEWTQNLLRMFMLIGIGLIILYVFTNSISIGTNARIMLDQMYLGEIGTLILGLGLSIGSFLTLLTLFIFFPYRESNLRTKQIRYKP